MPTLFCTLCACNIQRKIKNTVQTHQNIQNHQTSVFNYNLHVIYWK